MHCNYRSALILFQIEVSLSEELRNGFVIDWLKRLTPSPAISPEDRKYNKNKVLLRM
jgi:hypothetical protein